MTTEIAMLSADLDIDGSADSRDTDTELPEQDAKGFERPENLSELNLSPIEALQAKYIAFLEERLKSLDYSPSLRSFE